MSIFKPPRSDNWYFDFQLKGNRFSGSTGTANRREAEEFERRRRKAAEGEVAAGQKERCAPMTILAAGTRYWNEVGQFAPRPDQVDWSLE